MKPFQRVLSALCLLLFASLFAGGILFGEEGRPAASPLPPIRAFQPGEVLTYNVSWSNVISAGIAVMEVTEERLPDGSTVYRFIAKDRSTGTLNAFYSVEDSYQSVFDPRELRALSFSLREMHKKKPRAREVRFDYEKHTVVSTLNEDPPQRASIPDRVQDSLSSIYYLRTMEDLASSKTVTMHVFDSGKIWSVEIETLGRERVSTPAGEFDTIKVRTNPKYQGVFKTRGDMYFWLTDDIRKVPVLIRSRLPFGSIVMTLAKVKPGGDKGGAGAEKTPSPRNNPAPPLREETDRASER